jgi:hypothetical protein
MSIDDYYLSHNHKIDYTMDIYANDDINHIEIKIEDFIIDKKINDKNMTSKIMENIINAKNGLSILDHKYITSIGLRIYYHSGSKTGIEWCLVNVWRRRNNLLK